DEADEMLDMGFADDLELLLDRTPGTRQTVLFSATLPPRIAAIAAAHLTDPERIEIERADVAAGEAPAVRQTAYVVPRSHKPAALGRVLDVENPGSTIVFCRTRLEVDELTETLNGRGYRAEALHGGMDQLQRDRVLGRLRSETADLLVATDVAARGLDIDHLTHVVNYDVPSAPESYVHRIGRVGRAGREGVAITLAEPRQHRLLKNIERVTGQRIEIERVPSIDDLRSRRLELLEETLAEAIVDTDNDRYRTVVESLAEHHDVMEIALAAIALFQEERGAEGDEVEIPEVTLRPDRDRRDRRDRDGRRDRRDRRDDWGDRRGARSRDDRPDRGGDRRGNDRRGDDRRGDDRGRRDRPPSPGMTRLFVPAGYDARIRPGDIVGAICNETNLSGRDIGAIEIKDRFSLVEVPDGAVDTVIDAFRHTTIKGRKVNVRREIKR
ncbi:MAG: DbpA RNA binding domain-containing protein, partial [Acidimicrobiales bacterium]|nr:DbpA RNA binding domain-containing protein [Acidimicrobiales bacterium]